MKYKRRTFLRTVAAATVIAAHDTFLCAEQTGRVASPDAARITGLRLQTAAPLQAMKDYYHERFELPVLRQTSDRLTIGAGTTSITFERADPEQGQPCYHFAFNIPENKTLAARNWLRARTELIAIPAGLRDPEYPDDVVHFRNWNAHSLFFLDPAENIVELIARHDLRNAARGPFTANHIQYASEIAFVVDDVPAAAAGVQQAFELGAYRSGSDQFYPIGDEHGLLLLFRRRRKLSFEHPRVKLADVFSTAVTIRAKRAQTHRIPEFPYVIRSADNDHDE
jgi:catechol-2,3-dioxygenase